MAWKDKKTVKKGDIGEKIVDDYLRKKGLIIYKPISDNAHSFDRLVSQGKNKFVIVEVKTKAKRNAFPDTGIDYRHYKEYKAVSNKHNMPVWLFFVDEMLGEVYGNDLEKLEAKTEIEHNSKKLAYPMVKEYKASTIIYFYQPSMKLISKLTKEDIEEIKKYASRNHVYIK